MRKKRRNLRGVVGSAARLTRRGWGMLLVGLAAVIGAYATGRHELLYVACLLMILPLAAYLIVRGRRLKLATSRTFSPHVVAAGSSTTVTVDVQNLSPTWSTAARWQDVLPWHPYATAERSLPSLAPRRPRLARENFERLDYLLRAPSRGVFDIGPLALEYGDPFGLARGVLGVGGSEPLTVIPDVVALPESGLSIAAGDGSARLIQRRATGNDDDLMTREYRMGDALRRVHWRASARHGELMVRQEEQRTYPEARIILDTRRPGYADVSTDKLEGEPESASFEWAVRMVASLGVHLHRSGFLVHAIETGPAQIRPLGDASQWTGRDEDFLVSLASIQLATPHVGSVAGSEDNAEGALGPAFAVVGSPEADTVKWLARQRRPYELAVVFILGAQATPAVDYLERVFGIQPKLTPAVEYLEKAGWIVVQVGLHDDPVSAWMAVVSETGAVHDPA
jgi:uncharacterized protein (DUF58 family)